MTTGGGRIITKFEDGSPTDYEGKGFDNFLEMWSESTSSISKVTFSSLKGFVLKMNIGVNKARYANLNDKTTNFDKIVTEYIIKFALLSEHGSDSLPRFADGGRTFKKETESPHSYHFECETQQKIWVKSTMLKNPLCPSVCEFAIFDNNNAKKIVKNILIIPLGTFWII